MDVNKKLSDLRSFLTGILATKFHYLIIFGIICGIAITLLIDRPDFTVRGLIYFIPGFLVAILLFVLYRKGRKYPDSLILIQANGKFFQITLCPAVCILPSCPVFFILPAMVLFYFDHGTFLRDFFTDLQ